MNISRSEEQTRCARKQQAAALAQQQWRQGAAEPRSSKKNCRQGRGSADTRAGAGEQKRGCAHDATRARPSTGAGRRVRMLGSSKAAMDEDDRAQGRRQTATNQRGKGGISQGAHRGACGRGQELRGWPEASSSTARCDGRGGNQLDPERTVPLSLIQRRYRRKSR